MLIQNWTTLENVFIFLSLTYNVLQIFFIYGLVRKKAKIILLWILLEAIMLVAGKFTVYSQIYLFVSRGGGRCATAHPIFSQMPIFISFLEKKKFWKSDKIWPIYRQMQFFFAYFQVFCKFPFVSKFDTPCNLLCIMLRTQCQTASAAPANH